MLFDLGSSWTLWWRWALVVFAIGLGLLGNMVALPFFLG